MRHDARDRVPAVAGQERHDVDRDEPLDPLGRALREREPDRAPVVHDEPHAVEPGVRAEALEPVGVAGDRVVEVAALRAAAEAGQVGRDAAGALEERRPQIAGVGHAVEVQHGRVAAGRAAPDDRQAVELVVVGGDHGRRSQLELRH